MRFVSCVIQDSPTVLVRRNGQYLDIRRADPTLPSTLREILEHGPDTLRRIAELDDAPTVDADAIRYLPVIPNPDKILCVGLNYEDHARESGSAIPNEPVIFNKLRTALCAHRDPIQLPRASRQVDYEAELVVVIGKQGRHISQQDAWDYVAGVTCGHDVSARDWQKDKPERQWLLGKSFDTFAPIGPELVTLDELPRPLHLDIQLRRNGEVMQQSNTRQFIFGIDKLIEYISQVATLMPGDLLFTGTPPGVGVARKPPVFLQPGDVYEVEIEQLGVLRNPVVDE